MESFTSANQVQTRTTIVANLPLKGFFKPQGKFNKGNKMAVLTSTTLSSATGVVTATVNTAAASDTMTYVAGAGQLVEMDNTTGGSLTLNIKGSAPSATYPIKDTATTTDLSAGYNVTIAAGAKKIINLDKIKAYLAGNNTVTLSGAATLKITVYA